MNISELQKFVNLIDVVYIYALIDPETSGVRYIGQAECPKCRYTQHLTGSFQQEEYHLPKSEWIRDLINNDLAPRLKILEQCQKEDGWSRECHWINHYVDEGDNLLNIKHRTGHYSN